MSEIEPVSLMEPMLPEGRHRDLEDRVLELAGSSERLHALLPAAVQRSIGGLVRSMNCYYSNLIEGHDTHPRDIDRALARDYSTQPVKRALQQEAAAHIEVQAMIDRGEEDPKAEPVRLEYLLWLHKSFCDRLPDELLWSENPMTKRRFAVIPGRLRETTVAVGRHVAPRPESLPRFLARFEEAYTAPHRSRAECIIAVGAAHHRLLWIHPFLDGNGRVARLMSHAMLRRLGIGTPLWSASRGLARRVGDYKSLLANADEPRRHDTDGRGSLSHDALVAFCRFFLDVCIDQVRYMTSLLAPSELLNRMKVHTEEEIAARRLPRGSFEILREALLAGELDRGRAAAASGYQERRGRTTLAALVSKGLLVSDGPKKPVRLAFPFDVVERWFPLLYPTTV